MKQNIIAASVIAMAIGTLFTGHAQAQSNPAAAALVSTSIGNSIKGGVNVNQIGSSSESSAINTQSAQASASLGVAQANNAAAATFTGTTVQTGSNSVWNYSQGPNAGGFAQSSDTNKVGTLGIANIANIGAVSATSQPTSPIGLTITGISGDLGAAATSSVLLSDSNYAGTNQGIITATQGNSSVGVTLGASTGGAIASGSNTVALTGTSTGDVSINTAQGDITLKTGGVNGDGSPATTTLSGGSNSVTGTGAFSAGLNGSGSVIAVSGTNDALAQAIVPGINEIVTPGTVAQGISK